jgi:multidrug resistance efflux pump
MIALFTALYCLAIWLFYVKRKVKPTPTNLAVCVVIGINAIGGIVICWRFASPNSSNLVVSRYTVQLVPQVNGPVTKIHAAPNVPLKKGEDILYEIQPDIYQNTVNQLTASLQAEKNHVVQLEAGVHVAKATVKQNEASRAAALAEFEVAKGIQDENPSAIAEIKVKQAEEKFNASSAAVEQATASVDQAEAGLARARDTVLSLEAELANAQFKLDQCIVYAPADGFVTNWQVREGTMAVSLPFAPIGLFIDTSHTTLVASFSQNVCRNVKPGDSVEISLKTRPGEVFTGKVEAIVQASGEGQFVTTGQFKSVADIGSEGQLAVKLLLDDLEVANSLAMGTAGTVVVYTDWGKPFQVISTVAVRMNAWMYYINPF